MTTLYEISAFIDDEGEVRPFYLRISKAVRDSETEDYYCSVHAPMLFERDKNIYGVDAEQAQTLAFEFIRRVLGSRRLIDKDGKSIDLQ